MPVPVGTRVELLYDPANPTDATIKSFTEIWFLPIVLLLLGLPFLLVGIVGFMR